MHITKLFIILGLDNGQLHILDHEGENERVMNACRKGIWCVDAWEDDWFIAGGVDGRLSVWELGDGELKEKIELSGHTVEDPEVNVRSTIRSVKAISATKAISASRDTTMKVWNLENGTCEAVFEGHTNSIRSIAVHGDLVASASYDFDARVWSLGKKECLQILKGHTAQIYSIDFDDRGIVTGSLDKTVRIWDPASGECQAVLKGYTSLVAHTQLLPSTLVTGDSAGVLRVWSLDNYSELHRIEAHGNSVTSIDCDGSRIASGGSDGKVKIWNLETGELLQDLVDSDAVWQVGFLKDGLAAAFSSDSEVKLQTWGTSDFK